MLRGDLITRSSTPHRRPPSCRFEALHCRSTCRNGHAGEQPTVAVEPAHGLRRLDIADWEQKARPWFNDEVRDIANMRSDGNTSAGERLDQRNRLPFEADGNRNTSCSAMTRATPAGGITPEETYPVHLASEKTAQLRIIRARHPQW
jgi:hypothetical protein